MELTLKMSAKEHENFLKHCILVVDVIKGGLTDLIQFDIDQRNLSFEDFINQNQHHIYHLHYNRVTCCQGQRGNACPIYYNRILRYDQLDILLDKNGPTRAGHNPNRTNPFCCSFAKPGLKVGVLDTTLANCLLINFCRRTVNGSIGMALNTLVDIRNKVYGHATDANMTDIQFNNCWNQAERALIHISRICGTESQTRQKLGDLQHRSLDETLLIQYQNKILEDIQKENDIRQIISSSMHSIKESVSAGLQSIEALVQDRDIQQSINEDSDALEDNVERVSLQLNPTHELDLNIDRNSPGWLDKVLNTAVNILEGVSFVCPQLSFIRDLAVFTRSLCYGVKDDSVKASLESFFEEKMDEEYEGNKELFVNAIIFMSATGFRRMNKLDVQTLILTMNPLQSSAFLGKIRHRINNLKTNCRRRDFEKFMKYVLMYTNLAFLRYMSLLYLYKILEINYSVFLPSVKGLLNHQKKNDMEVLEFLVKPKMSCIKWNFMFSPKKYASVQTFLILHFDEPKSSEFLCEGEFMIQSIEYENAHLYFADIAYTWLRWSYYKNPQSIFKFNQHKIDGKTYFRIYSAHWPEYYARMGNDGWWVRGRCDEESDNYGLWEIVQLCDDEYQDDDYFMICPKDSRANFISVDSCGRIYGPRCNPGTYGLFKIVPVFYDAQEEISSDDDDVFYDAND